MRRGGIPVTVTGRNRGIERPDQCYSLRDSIEGRVQVGVLIPNARPRAASGVVKVAAGEEGERYSERSYSE